MTAFYEWNFLEFGPHLSDGMIPIPEAEYNSTERHVPYSDINILDLGGRSARHYETEIRLTIADFVAFDAAVGQIADLYLANILYPEATLVSLTNVRQTPRAEWVLCTAKWVL